MRGPVPVPRLTRCVGIRDAQGAGVCRPGGAQWRRCTVLVQPQLYIEMAAVRVALLSKLAEEELRVQLELIGLLAPVSLRLRLRLRLKGLAWGKGELARLCEGKLALCELWDAHCVVLVCSACARARWHGGLCRQCGSGVRGPVLAPTLSQTPVECMLSLLTLNKELGSCAGYFTVHAGRGTSRPRRQT